MSHISYSDVLDPQEAVKCLSGKSIVVILLVSFYGKISWLRSFDITCTTAATGYVCSLEDTDTDTDGLHDNHIEEMLNLLIISELRDVLCKLKKVCSWRTLPLELLVPF